MMAVTLEVATRDGCRNGAQVLCMLWVRRTVQYDVVLVSYMHGVTCQIEQIDLSASFEPSKCAYASKD